MRHPWDRRLGFWWIAEDHPDQPAVAVSPSGLTPTFGELAARAHQIVHALRSRGLGRDDVIAYALPNDVDVVWWQLAMQEGGLRGIALNPSLSGAEIRTVPNLFGGPADLQGWVQAPERAPQFVGFIVEGDGTRALAALEAKVRAFADDIVIDLGGPMAPAGSDSASRSMRTTMSRGSCASSARQSASFRAGAHISTTSEHSSTRRCARIASSSRSSHGRSEYSDSRVARFSRAASSATTGSSRALTSRTGLRSMLAIWPRTSASGDEPLDRSADRRPGPILTGSDRASSG